MKIKFGFHCNKCLKQTDMSKESLSQLKDYKFVFEVNDDNIYEGVCDYGHKIFFTLQEEKFEILFNFASIALLDGYTKEAVSTLSSSYERFIEFYIKTICTSYLVDNEYLDKAWSKMKNQSERQIGAFYALQLADFGKVKYLINEDWVKFRNQVIHQGYIPKYQEAINYGEYILENIYSILNDLYKSHSKSLSKTHAMNQIQKIKNTTGESLVTLGKPTMIKVNYFGGEQIEGKKFVDSLKSLKESEWYKYIYVKES